MDVVDINQKQSISITFTGHRPERLRGKEKVVRSWIATVLTELKYKYNIENAYCRMAQGGDKMFGIECVLHGIPLICCYPFAKDYYHPVEQALIDKSEDLINVGMKYVYKDGKKVFNKKAYYDRDCYMVDHADILIAVFDGIESGGTWLTINHAIKTGKKVIYLPKEILLEENK